MNSILVGLALVLVGIFFNSALVIVFGLLCFLLGAYSTKSGPVRAVKETTKEEKKTKHIVVMSEPPESTLMPWERGEVPSAKFDPQSFLPLPEYGYSGPLEQVFFGFPVKFWKK